MKIIAITALTISSSCAFLTPLPQARITKGVAMKAEALSGCSRKDLLQAGAAAGSLGLLSIVGMPPLAGADVEEVPLSRTKLGGLLEPFSDISKGFKLFRPSGWNQFDGVPGEYDVKFVDIVNAAEVVQVSTTPVKSDTKLAALGDVAAVGAKLAKGKGAELVSAKERSTEGITFYDFEFKAERMHEVRTLCINKGKLWSLTAMTPERQWGKREQTYAAIQTSFLPKL